MRIGIVFLGLICIFVGFIEPKEVGNFLLIVSGFIFTLLGSVSSSTNEKEISQINSAERLTIDYEKWFLKELSKYKVSLGDEIDLCTANKFYIVNPETMKVIFIKQLDEVENSFDYKVIDLNRVRKISIQLNKKIISEITMENDVRRQSGGGSLFGLVKAKSVRLEVITNELIEPYKTILLYEEKDELNNTDIKKMEHAIYNLYWAMYNCLQKT
ncbi:hypothetical protein ACFPYN_07500 [Paenisporosarcina macmurdoensis]|uniref:Uncharacterized protein n=1 Tax=Paenisporosarcina macmurdoensis TaxID=212659 RepID=A0ABW1L5Q8_9BACL